MNNPDEETAVAQFGKGDKYFGIATLLVTMPGLPMFGHGQIDGFEEKYGMEYRRSYRDEVPDGDLVGRHEREIFPLMKKRYLFSGSADFCLFDLYDTNGVNENVFAYSNRAGSEAALIIYNNSYSQVSGWIKEGAAHIPQKEGGTRRDNLGQALRLHGEELHFTLFREQRQNLWFIRSSKDLSERGLFVSLNGYEAQVFLDIHEAVDTEAGSAAYRWNARWSKLNAELEGRGIADPAAALKEIFLGELYAPLLEAFNPENIEALNNLILKPGADTKKAAAFAASLTKAAGRFAEEALRHLDGAGGRYEAWREGVNSNTVDTRKAAAETLRSFTANVEFLLALGRNIEKDTDLDAATARLFRDLAGEISARPRIALYAAAAGFLGLLRPVLSSPGAGHLNGGSRSEKAVSGAEILGLVEFWDLDRKMREIFTAAGASGEEASRAVEFIKAALARSSGEGSGNVKAVKPSGKKPAAKTETSAAALALQNYDAPDIRALLKINVFEDVTWYNKEALEEALVLFPLLALMQTGKAGAKKTAALSAAFKKAAAAAEYRLDRLIAALPLEKTAKGKTAAKNSKTTGGAGKPGKGNDSKTAAKPKNKNTKEGKAKAAKKPPAKK
jgi:hypothetical protein